MDPIAQTFLAEIDAYLKASGTDATTFGKQVLATRLLFLIFARAVRPPPAPWKRSAPL